MLFSVNKSSGIKGNYWLTLHALPPCLQRKKRERERRVGGSKRKGGRKEGERRRGRKKGRKREGEREKENAIALINILDEATIV